MTDQIKISIDRETYEQLQLLMVPPVNDVNAVIKELLYYDGRTSPAAAALEASEHHFSMEQEIERNRQGIYEGGGNP